MTTIGDLTMTTTDTRAAVDAAIYAATGWVRSGDEAAIDAAITAHVTAEVARRLTDRDPWHRHVVYSCCGNPAQVPDGGARMIDNCSHCTVAIAAIPGLDLCRCPDETVAATIARVIRERNEYAEKLAARNAAIAAAIVGAVGR